MKTILIFTLLTLTSASDCDKNMNYHEDHGYGYEIICTQITDTNIAVIQDIVIDKEYSLLIQHSTIHKITPKIFGKVTKINSLIIEDSVFDFNNQSVLSRLGELQHLKILRTKFVPFKKVFEGLKELEELHLDGNGIEVIEEGVLEPLVGLKVLKVTNNRLKHLKDLPLCEVKNINFLNLERNLLPTLRYHSFSCNKHRDTIDISLNDNQYDVGIQDQSYMNTSESFTNLVSVNFNYNNISDLGYALSELKNVKTIELEGNHLEEIRGYMLESLVRLESLNLQDNKLRFVDDKVFLGKPKLRKLNLRGNLITSINLNSTTSLEYLNLADNKLVLDSLSILSNLKSLNELIISDNHIVEVFPNEFRNFTSLETLDLSSNNLSLHGESFNDLLSLKFLYISRNNLKEIPKGLFSVTKNLKTLDISHNLLSSLPSNLFNELINLETLNISSNRLQDLPYVLFRPLKNLNALDIAGNRLKNLQYELIINNLPALSIINIKNNWLSCDFLTKMIGFLEKKSISYSMNGKLEYEIENVHGIHCTQELREEETKEENIIAHHLVGESSTPSAWAILLIATAAVVTAGFGSYKLALCYKRRRYTVDQFELIEGQ